MEEQENGSGGGRVALAGRDRYAACDEFDWRFTFLWMEVAMSKRVSAVLGLLLFATAVASARIVETGDVEQGFMSFLPR
jgi:hypothetical protein